MGKGRRGMSVQEQAEHYNRGYKNGWRLALESVELYLEKSWPSYPDMAVDVFRVNLKVAIENLKEAKREGAGDERGPGEIAG